MLQTRLQQPPRRPQEQLAALREHLLAQHGVPPQHVVEQLLHLPPERADDPNPREGLAHPAVDLLHVGAQRPVDGPDAPRERQAQQHDAGDDGHGRQGQPPVQREQHAHRDDQPQDRNGR